MPQLAGPPQSLPSITESLSAFPLLEPKKQQLLQERLEAPVIGTLGRGAWGCSGRCCQALQLSSFPV
jgi:hypothetical protein